MEAGAAGRSPKAVTLQKADSIAGELEDRVASSRRAVREAPHRVPEEEGAGAAQVFRSAVMTAVQVITVEAVEAAPSAVVMVEPADLAEAAGPAGPENSAARTVALEDLVAAGAPRQTATLLALLILGTAARTRETPTLSTAVEGQR